MTSAPWLVVGLGNPGAHYESTRHNIGHLVVDRLAERCHASWRRQRGAKAQVAETRLEQGGARLVLVRPTSYMNESGPPVKAVARFFKVPVERLVVIHDELDLPFGVLRVKRGGGDNGHNGLRSLRAQLASGDFYRVRLGIDRPTTRQPTADYVLSAFSAEERAGLPDHVERGVDAALATITDGLEAAQTRYNG